MPHSSHAIMRELLSQFQGMKPNVQKFNDNLVLAQAERLIKIINLMTPHAELFDDAFKKEIKDYIMLYEEARNTPSSLLLAEISALVTPIDNLIQKTLKYEIAQNKKGEKE